MSARQDPVSTGKPAESAPEIEYRTVSTDSLSMFLAAIGGAFLGMLLTLLILALINGGTLRFNSELSARVEGIDQNVGAVSDNINIVSERAAALQTQLASVETALRNELDKQNGDVAGMTEAVSQLNQTRQQFNTFMGALAQALSTMGVIETPAAAAAPETEASAPEAKESAPAAEEPATLAAPIVIASADVSSKTIAVLLFADANQDGQWSEGETNLAGLSVALLDGAGQQVSTVASTEAGAQFTDLAAGDYQVTVADALKYKLLSAAQVTVTVAETGAGTLVYFPVAAE